MKYMAAPNVHQRAASPRMPNICASFNIRQRVNLSRMPNICALSFRQYAKLQKTNWKQILDDAMKIQGFRIPFPQKVFFVKHNGVELCCINSEHELKVIYQGKTVYRRYKIRQIKV